MSWQRLKDSSSDLRKPPDRYISECALSVLHALWPETGWEAYDSASERMFSATPLLRSPTVPTFLRTDGFHSHTYASSLDVLA